MLHTAARQHLQPHPTAPRVPSVSVRRAPLPRNFTHHTHQLAIGADRKTQYIDRDPEMRGKNVINRNSPILMKALVVLHCNNRVCVGSPLEGENRVYAQRVEDTVFRLIGLSQATKFQKIEPKNSFGL